MNRTLLALRLREERATATDARKREIDALLTAIAAAEQVDQDYAIATEYEEAAWEGAA